VKGLMLMGEATQRAEAEAAEAVAAAVVVVETVTQQTRASKS
jgi:hypothetical protein